MKSQCLSVRSDVMVNGVHSMLSTLSLGGSNSLSFVERVYKRLLLKCVNMDSYAVQLTRPLKRKDGINMPMIRVCDTCKDHPKADISSIWVHDEDYYRAEITRQEYEDNEQCEGK